MEHPNIIRLIESAIINNELYIVLEWAEKGDLKTMIKEAKERDISFSEENIWEYLSVHHRQVYDPYRLRDRPYAQEQDHAQRPEA